MAVAESFLIPGFSPANLGAEAFGAITITSGVELFGPYNLNLRGAIAASYNLNRRLTET